MNKGELITIVADAAGVTHVVPESAGGIEATLAVLSTGISTVSDTGVPIVLKLNLTDSEITEAARYLSLRYTTTGISMEYNNSGSDP